MTNIMASKTHAPGSNTIFIPSSFTIDPANSQSSLLGPSNATIFQKKSLNKGLRKKELMKITMENQAILKRLQDK